MHIFLIFKLACYLEHAKEIQAKSYFFNFILYFVLPKSISCSLNESEIFFL
jgi:hypothetical protein